jgi:hypothetical protein
MKLYIDGENDISYITNHIKFELSSVFECHYILSAKIPWGIDYKDGDVQEILKSYIKAQHINKKVLIFLISDSSSSYEIPENVYLFRTSLYKTKQQRNEFVLPFVWDSLLERDILPFEKTKYPIVGFCGLNNKIRHETMVRLLECEEIAYNFIIREHFWGGKPNDPELINDYINNIANSHFTLCNRGEGNFSIRFYQVLSAGRIPVFIDTDMKLPFENEINWKDISVSAKDNDELVANILDFYKTKDLDVVYKECRRIYTEFFSTERYFQIILSKIESGSYVLD